MAKEGKCCIEGCTKTRIVARGMCSSHYYRFRWHGDPSVGRFNGEQERETLFWDKVEKGEADDDCWVWTAFRNAGGYGLFWTGETRPSGAKRMSLAHRWAYERFVGPVPDGLYVLHRCDNPPCVRPEHLYAGTQLQNMQDKARRGRNASTGLKKLTSEQVLEIRRLYGEGDVSHAELGKRFGVTRKNISQIVNRASWRSI